MVRYPQMSYNEPGRIRSLSLSLLLYRTDEGVALEKDGGLYRLPGLDFDTVFEVEDALEFLDNILADLQPEPLAQMRVMAPIGGQEVWAAGVT